ncbi:hypothetical protein C8Q78DRAFT_1078957 [Trametes maxima]|nr:hypothetical protein C8Q78DRAFT_1078957 [Trametes maxima]
MSPRRCVYNAPMALDFSLSRTCGLDPHLALARNRDYIHDAKEYTLGPMPPASFIDTFLPATSTNRKSMLSSKNAFQSIPQRADETVQIYEPLVCRTACVWFVLSQSRTDISVGEENKAQVTVSGLPVPQHRCAKRPPPRLGFAKPHICCVTSKNAPLVQQADLASRVEFGYAEFFIQTSPNPEIDFYVDPAPCADRDTRLTHEFVRLVKDDKLFDQVQRSYGLHLAFVMEVFARQHRLFLFTASISGSFARFYRWDRTGCIVTEAFDVHQYPNILCEFLWRFSQLSDAQRGHDLTLEVFDEELSKAVTAHYQRDHVIVVDVFPRRSDAPVDQDVRGFIVSRPVVSPLSLDGRTTRGYWAVDTSSSQVVFLKDTWLSYPRKEVEGDILQHLNELNVQNTPSLSVHGYVPDDQWYEGPSDGEPVFQNTRADQFVYEPWVRRIDGRSVYVYQRRHYRMVTDAAGYSLSNLRGTDELLYATHDVFIAMRDALAKDSRIHRDLSVGNIILVKEADRAVRKGYLIDWEVSDRVDDAGKSIRPGRTGTWAFLSLRMVDEFHERGKHTFADDMEALLYVVFYCGLFYLPHDLTEPDLTRLHSRFFEHRETYAGATYGGDGKLMNTKNRLYTNMAHFASAAYAEWLHTVVDFNAPPPELAEKYKDMWTPEKLDAYWTEFLATHELERNNRSVHQVSKHELYDSRSPPTPPPSPPLHPRAHPRYKLARMRREALAAAAGEPQPKRPRPDEASSSHPPVAQPDETLVAPVLRRMAAAVLPAQVLEVLS